MVGWALDGHALVTVGDFDIMHPVVCTNYINTIIGAEVGTADSQMIDFQIDSEVKDDVELGAVNQDKIMHRGIDGRDETNQPGAVGAKILANHYIQVDLN